MKENRGKSCSGYTRTSQGKASQAKAKWIKTPQGKANKIKSRATSCQRQKRAAAWQEMDVKAFNKAGLAYAVKMGWVEQRLRDWLGSGD